MIKTIPFYQSLIGKGTLNEILLYGLIEVLSHKEGFCYATNSFLAAQLGLTPGTITNLLHRLKQKDWITVQMKDEKHRECIIPSLEIKAEETKNGTKCIHSTMDNTHSGIDTTHSTMGTYPSQNGTDIHSTMDIYNNIYNNDNNINKDLSLLIGETPKSEVVENFKKFGNEQIDEAFAIWENCFGIPQKNNAANRRAAYNLLRAKDKGLDWIKNSLKILVVAKRTKFVRKEVSGISNYSDLQRNWEYLWQWGRSYAESKAKQTVTDKI